MTGSSRRFFDAGATDQGGAAFFSALPATVAGETYRVEAARSDGVGAVTSLVVVAGATAEASVSLVDGGDLDVCDAAGPCVARSFFNDTALRLRLRGTPVGVDTLVVTNGCRRTVRVQVQLDNYPDPDCTTIPDTESRGYSWYYPGRYAGLRGC